MPKLKPLCPRKTKAGVRGVSPVGGKAEELRRKKIAEKISFEPGVEMRRMVTVVMKEMTN